MVVRILANVLRTREDALRLFLCVLAGYPLAAFHRSVLYNKPRAVQHAFFVVTGLLMYIFSYGYDTIHSLIAIVYTYVITNFMGGNTDSIIVAHLSLLGHLLVAYWFEESDGYDITWTTPFCVMTLRFIGLVMDIYDGVHYEKLKENEKKSAIKDVPGLLEIAAFGFFYTGTFAGPQFSLSKFRECVNGEWLDEQKRPRQSAVQASLERFLGGCIYTALNQLGTAWIPNSYFNTPEFYNESLFWRWTWVTIWFRFVVSRYCGMWMITCTSSFVHGLLTIILTGDIHINQTLKEGAAILNGLGYNGKDKNGQDRWDGVRDIHVWKWETGNDFTSGVQSFNCGTNTWAKNHVMRRLRWLNNKPVAHIITLSYLAIWHGYHLGYFLLFGLEFGCMVAQEQLYSLIEQAPGLAAFLGRPQVQPFTWLFGRLTILYSMSFGFLTFGLVKTKYWIGPIKSLYFIGYIFYFVIWPLLHQLLLSTLPKKPKSANSRR